MRARNDLRCAEDARATHRPPRLAAALAVVLASAAVVAQQNTSPGPRVEISFAAAARSAPVTGRVYVAISRVNDRQTPIQQADSTGAPLFGKNVDSLAPGAAAVIGSDDFGHPIASLRDIPAGDYWVQPFVNVYTKFARADGHTVWLHMDQWEGQNWQPVAGQPLRRSRADALRSGIVGADPRSSPTRSFRRCRCRRTRTRSSASRSRARF